MTITLEAGIAAAATYYSGDVAYPFFICVDGTREEEAILASLPSSFRPVRLSVYCGDDSWPDYDEFLDEIRELNSNAVLRGLGECASLTRNYDIFGKLKDMTFSNKVIVICRNVLESVKQLQRNDSKFTSLRWCVIASHLDYSIVRVLPSVKIPTIEGFKALLDSLESFEKGKRYVHTDLPLANVSTINSAYAAIKDRDALFTVEETCLGPEQWGEYLQQSGLSDFGIQHWRTYLNMLIYGTESPYLRLVMSAVHNYLEYQDKLLSAILLVKHTNSNFHALYEERKQLLKNLPEHEIEGYVILTKSKDMDRIHYLTNNTLVEKRAIVEELSHIKAVPDDLALLYPDLLDYLNDFQFTGPNDSLLTGYFAQYKRQKVFNFIEPEFLQNVSDLSQPGNRKYNGLTTRAVLLMPLKKQGNALYWLDALGVEYLGYIQKKAAELDLRISVQVGRSILPTLTDLNRSFYDEWNDYKSMSRNLDKLKHYGCGQIGIKRTDPPIHLADELEVIMCVLLEIRSTLIQHHAERVIFTSDHGASRLAVLNQNENKWKMATKGKHSGRCCPKNEIDEKPDSATEEHGFWVLANYDLFQGGHKANVEVHGGASLEEVVIPVIEVELATKKIECHVMAEGDPAVIIESLDGDPELPIFCSNQAARLTVRINGNVYASEQDASNKCKFIVRLPGVWRNGTYSAEVFDGDNGLCNITFTIQKEKRSPKKNRDGMEFFGS